MSPPLPPLRLTGAQMLRDGVLQARSLVLRNGRIDKGPLPEADLSGYLLLPGIVDISSLAVDTQPLPDASARLARAGVTTAWLTQHMTWEQGPQGADRMEAQVQHHAQVRASLATDLRLQLRLETHLPEQRDRILAAIKRYDVGYVTLCNSLPRVRALSALERAGRARALNVTETAYDAAMRQAQEAAREVPRHLCMMAEAFDRLGVTYGSHADPDGATREYFRILGARITEAPLAPGAAAMANACNDPVVLSAQSLVDPVQRPGALQLVARGFCNALASCGQPDVLAKAAWTLVDAGLMPLDQAWRLISSEPAETLMLADRGALDHGKRADVVIMNAETRQIEATIAAGCLTFAEGEVAARLRPHVTDPERRAA